MFYDIIKLAIFAILLAVGQILFKLSALKIGQERLIENLDKLLLMSTFIFALAIYGTATILWIHILQHVSLGVAYSAIAFVFVLMPVAGWFLFSERYSPLYFLGMGCIILGLILIAFSRKL
ncbi:MAG: 4-amino-4-deoxy-L-arabinose-phospho-UDP flippase [Pseudomonadota bacterium]